MRVTKNAQKNYPKPCDKWQYVEAQNYREYIIGIIGNTL